MRQLCVMRLVELHLSLWSKQEHVSVKWLVRFTLYTPQCMPAAAVEQGTERRHSIACSQDAPFSSQHEAHVRRHLGFRAQQGGHVLAEL